MIVLVAQYASSQIDYMRKMAREFLSRINRKQIKLEIVCSYNRTTRTFYVSARLFLLGMLTATTIAVDRCEATSFFMALNSVFSLIK